MSYTKVTPQEAMEMMNDNVIILDVRSQEDFDEGHIRNAILLPHTEIKEKAESSFPDKDAKILVYCRTGFRSDLASNDLVSLGYTAVYNMGGLDDWTGEVVK